MLLDQKFGGVEDTPSFLYILERNEDFRVQEVVQGLLQLAILTEEAVIEVTVFGRINPDKVSASSLLKHGLDDHFLAPAAQLQKLVDVFLLNPIHFLQLLRLPLQVLHYLIDFLIVAIFRPLADFAINPLLVLCHVSG